MRFPTFVASIAAVLVTLTAGVCSFAAEGKVSAKDYFRTLNRVVFDGLREKGVDSVGPFSIATLESEFETVQYRVWPAAFGFLTGSGDTRFSAIHLVEKREVLVNQAGWANVPLEVRPAISLHETLGALGYNDENYELSFSLYIAGKVMQPARARAFAQSPELAKALSRVTRSNQEKIYVAQGGGSLVGGGGDHDELELKLRIFFLQNSLSGTLNDSTVSFLASELAALTVRANGQITDKQKETEGFVFQETPNGLSLEFERSVFERDHQGLVFRVTKGLQDKLIERMRR